MVRGFYCHANVSDTQSAGAAAAIPPNQKLNSLNFYFYIVKLSLDIYPFFFFSSLHLISSNLTPKQRPQRDNHLIQINILRLITKLKEGNGCMRSSFPKTAPHALRFLLRAVLQPSSGSFSDVICKSGRDKLFV